MLIGIIGKGKMGTLLASTAKTMNIDVAGLFDIDNQNELNSYKCDAIVDFSHRDNLDFVYTYCREVGCPLVYGTTGINENDKQKLDDLANYVPVFYSSNYSVGIAILNKVLKLVTPALKNDFDMEIIEKHHNQKKDAPSGTALTLLSSMDPNCEFKHVFGREGNVGARGKEIGIHAIRGGTVAGEHSCLFLGQDEILEFRHEASSRQIFVNGALKAVLFIVKQQCGIYGMEELLGD